MRVHAQLEKHWRHLCRVTDLPAVDLRASGDLRFSVSRCQGMSSATVDIIVTMGSYRALVYFLNSLRTHMKSCFLHRPRARRCIAIGMRYEKTGFANSHSD